MTEKEMQTLFGKYLKKTPPKESEVYELKICKTSSLPFNSVKPHQIENLLQAETSSFYHKITDPPVFYGMNTKFNILRPFDCFCLVKVKAYIILWFFKPRKLKQFIKIRIKDFLKLKAISDRMSFNEQMVLGIDHEIINI